MRRTLAWLLACTAVVAAALFAAIVFGGFQLRDRNGTVLLGWDAARRSPVWMRPLPLQQDGPYVYRDADGLRVAETVRDANGWRLRTSTLPASPQPRVTVRMDDPARTRFEVAVRPPASPPPADHPRNPSRLLLLSDFEGEFGGFVALLRAQGVIDDGLHWRYGDGHLAIAGDLVDRGEHVIALLWLVYRLEHEAEQAGGRVHYVLGNHELLALADVREDWPRRMLASARALEAQLGETALSEHSVLGQWLRTRPVIARIGDHLVVHGGVSHVFLDQDLTVDAANALARPWLTVPHWRMPRGVRAVLGRGGVTRYRGMALPDDPNRVLEPDPLAHLRRVIARYGVRRVAIGHTLAPEVAVEGKGMLLRLDVDHARRAPQAALYEHGRLWRVDAEGGREPLD